MIGFEAYFSGGAQKQAPHPYNEQATHHLMQLSLAGTRCFLAVNPPK